IDATANARRQAARANRTYRTLERLGRRRRGERSPATGTGVANERRHRRRDRVLPTAAKRRP
ncbi:MAG: hypothetical protein LC792_25110, partial [Actinobacteria bacterium]|nr:hypothetical protein [Actinomycetota bacterium]